MNVKRNDGNIRFLQSTADSLAGKARVPMNALAVLNVGGKYMLPKTRRSFQAACRRWNCTYVEFTEPLAPVHYYWQKTFAVDRLQEFDRVLQLDADMLIRSDCPSPFSLTPDDTMGVVSARQYLGLPGVVEARERAVRLWARRMNMKVPLDERHLNSGFLLYSPKHHADVFKRCREVGRRWKWDSQYIPDQATLSVLLFNEPSIKACWLPHTWNANHANLPRREDLHGDDMRQWIYHFNGPNTRRRIRATRWHYPQGPPKRRIARRSAAILKRLPQGPVVGVEVGVLRAGNAALLLEHHEQLHLHLVDMWQPHPAGGRYCRSGDIHSTWTTDDWRVIWESVYRNLRPYFGRWQIHQCDSASCSRLFDDGSLDFVFIDADHTYEGCRRDIKAWASKVKPGGWIGGHDYGHPNRRWGVKRAVDEWAAGRPVERDVDMTWFART